MAKDIDDKNNSCYLPAGIKKSIICWFTTNGFQKNLKNIFCVTHIPGILNYTISQIAFIVFNINS